MVEKKVKTISGFRGYYRWLSNFYPQEIIIGGKIWPTPEHLYQASKFIDPLKKEEIREAPEPGDAKRLAKTLRPIREDWHDIKLSVMAFVISLKFKNAALREKLIATGDAVLVEENYWGDTYWGVCKGRGENMLGKIIMDERAKIMLELTKGSMV